MEGTRNRRREILKTQGNRENTYSHATRSNLESLRKSLQYSTPTSWKWFNVVTPEMVLKENIGSDRSWVYTATADVSEGTPAIETLAIRFGNSESIVAMSFQANVDAQLFKQHFEKAQAENAKKAAS